MSVTNSQPQAPGSQAASLLLVDLSDSSFLKSFGSADTRRSSKGVVKCGQGFNYNCS